MGESIFFRPISNIFATVSFIESLIWSSLSFLAILCMNDVIKYDRNAIKDDLKQFTEYLYNLYFSGKPYAADYRAIDQNDFQIIIWIYFIISLFWCFSSAVQLIVLSQSAKTRKFNVSTTVFLTLSFLACLYDLATMIIFAIDYHQLKGLKRNDAAGHELLLSVPIMLMILSAKGFVLWVANLTFSVIITVMFAQKSSGENFLWVKKIPDTSVYAQNNLAYNAYGDEPISFESNASKSENQTWLSKISTERFKLFNFFGKNSSSIIADDNKSTTSWSQMPRANSVTSRTRSSISNSVLRSSSSLNTRPISISPIYHSIISPVAAPMPNSVPEPLPDYSPPLGRKAIFSPQPPLRSALKRI